MGRADPKKEEINLLIRRTPKVVKMEHGAWWMDIKEGLQGEGGSGSWSCTLDNLLIKSSVKITSGMVSILEDLQSGWHGEVV